jgi:hypothetical protein
MWREGCILIFQKTQTLHLKIIIMLSNDNNYVSSSLPLVRVYFSHDGHTNKQSRHQGQSPDYSENVKISGHVSVQKAS